MTLLFHTPAKSVTGSNVATLSAIALVCFICSIGIEQRGKTMDKFQFDTLARLRPCLGTEYEEGTLSKRLHLQRAS